MAGDQEFREVITDIQREEEGAPLRAEALMLLDENHLGRAIVIKDSPSLSDVDKGAEELTVPDAYVLPMTEQRHLVLCNDGRMVIVERPTDGEENARSYDRTFVIDSSRTETSGLTPPRPMTYFRPHVMNIDQLIHRFGRKNSQQQSDMVNNWVTTDSRVSDEYPHFPGFVMEAVTRSCALQGKNDVRTGIQDKVMEAFIDKGVKPRSPGPSSNGAQPGNG